MMLGLSLWRTYKELGKPREPGDHKVGGLGTVRFDQERIDAAREHDGEVKYELCCVSKDNEAATYRIIHMDLIGGSWE